MTLVSLFWNERVSSCFRPAARSLPFLPGEKSRNYCNGCQTTSLLINTEVSKRIINDTGEAVKRRPYGGKQWRNVFSSFCWTKRTSGNLAREVVSSWGQACPQLHTKSGRLKWRECIPVCRSTHLKYAVKQTYSHSISIHKEIISNGENFGIFNCDKRDECLGDKSINIE